MTGAGRRRSWLLLAVVGLVVLFYLTAWSTYAEMHTRDRYAQLAPGEPGSRGAARFRVLSLVRADRLVASDGGDPQVPEAAAVFVVAEVEMVQQRPEPFVTCSDLDLLGPGGRRWESTGTEVQRRVPYCDSEDVAIGQPYRFETVYTVPVRDAEELFGIALVDDSGPGRTPVLRPPA